MLSRLNIVKQRFDEISDLIIQPDIIADQKRYVQLTKEYKDLKSLMDKRDEYIIVTGNIAEAEEIMKDGSDAEMVEMAKLQLEESKEKLPQLEEEIKFLLIPKDPEDVKNAVMEIRAGTGGDSGLWGSRPSLSSQVGKRGQGSEVIKEGSQEQVMLKITSTWHDVGS